MYTYYKSTYHKTIACLKFPLKVSRRRMGHYSNPLKHTHTHTPSNPHTFKFPLKMVSKGGGLCIEVGGAVGRANFVLLCMNNA